MNFLRALFGRPVPSPSPPPRPVTAPAAPSNGQLIDDYAALMERDPPTPMKIVDASTLPHRKELILDALFLELERHNSQQMIDLLEIAATSIVQFQYNVGSKPLHKFGMDMTTLPNPSDLKAMADIAARMVALEESTRDQYNFFDKMVQDDLAFVNAKIRRAEAKRNAQK